MLLKASDFIVHDLSAESVFDGCVSNNNDGDDDDGQGTRGRSGRACGAEEGTYKLELVLRKWFAIDPSREMRAFVRDGVLIGALFPSIHTYVCVCACLFVSRCAKLDRHIAARRELLRVSERARDAGQDRVVLGCILDRARKAKVDRSCIL